MKMAHVVKTRIRAAVMIILLAVCLCLLLLPASAVAAESASLTILMRDVKTEEVVSGGKFAWYRIGDASVDGNRVSYRAVQGFDELQTALNGKTQSEVLTLDTAKAFDEYISEQGIAGTDLAIDENGQGEVMNLEHGIYLVRQLETAEGYEKVQPFCVSLPYEKEGKLYDSVTSYPKAGRVEPKNPREETPPDKPNEPDNPHEGTPPTPTPGKPTEPDKPENPGVNTPTPPVPTPTPQIPPQPTKPGVASGGHRETEKPAPIASGNRLPQTGQTNWPIPVLAGTGSVLFLIGWHLERKEDADKDTDKNAGT
jgi:LPXTG-motif cell wall-anchored protein